MCVYTSPRGTLPQSIPLVAINHIRKKQVYPISRSNVAQKKSNKLKKYEMMTKVYSESKRAIEIGRPAATPY